jgi:hypothetical protein
MAETELLNFIQNKLRPDRVITINESLSPKIQFVSLSNNSVATLIEIGLHEFVKPQAPGVLCAY